MSDVLYLMCRLSFDERRIHIQNERVLKSAKTFFALLNYKAFKRLAKKRLGVQYLVFFTYQLKEFLICNC